MPLKPKSTGIPKALQPTYDAVTVVTDRFCAKHLDEEYARYAAAALYSATLPNP